MLKKHQSLTLKKEKELLALVLEGESEAATKLRSEIRAAERQQLMFEMQAKMGQQ